MQKATSDIYKDGTDDRREGTRQQRGHLPDKNGKNGDEATGMIKVNYEWKQLW